MRFVLPAIALLSATATMAADPPNRAEPPQAVPNGAPVLIRNVQPARCRDTVHEVRAERGLPELRRETAKPGEELLIKAVDHRIDGCSMLVMHHDTRDVRPLATEPGAPQLRKIQ